MDWESRMSKRAQIRAVIHEAEEITKNPNPAPQSPFRSYVGFSTDGAMVIFTAGEGWAPDTSSGAPGTFRIVPYGG